MSKIFISICLAALMNVGCAPLRPEVTPDTYALCGPQPSQEMIVKLVNNTVAGKNWKDPDSIKIRNIQLRGRCAGYKGLINGGGYQYGWMVTYEINGKNSYGAYVGYEQKELIILPADPAPTATN
jgi:hypothetical protein